jgi:hypothetical protein
MILGAGCVVEAAENETRGYGPDGVLSLIVLKERKHQTNQQKPPVNWQYDSVVEYLPSMCEALSLNLTTEKKEAAPLSHPSTTWRDSMAPWSCLGTV